MIEVIKRKIFEWEDIFFEKRYGLQLGGIVKQEELAISNSNSVSHAMAYHATWCRSLRTLFAKAGVERQLFYSFVDIGSGKGKACFYAYTQKKFQKVIGVELSAELFLVAQENKNKLKNCNVEFVNADACNFKLDPAKTLVFMFNPFDEYVLEKFLSNNLSHFQKYGSVIAYSNDVCRSSLERLGFEVLFRDSDRSLSLHKYSSVVH